MKLTCSFSYSWNDADTVFLDELKNIIVKKSKFPIEVFYDKYSAEPGDNLDEMEEKISLSDVVVIFYTPSYKRKTQSFDNTGVKREYERILQRLKDESNFLLPILVKGDFNNSVPKEIHKTIFADISNVQNAYSKRNNKIVLSKELKNFLEKIAEKIIGKAFSNAQQKEIDFTDNAEELKQLLFERTHLEASEPFPPQCLVKMDAYQKILDQITCFVVGRKGTGKTTLLNTLDNFGKQSFHEKYKNVNPISMEMNNLLYAYEELYVAQQRDFSIIPLANILDVFWEIFLTLQCVKTIHEELSVFQITEIDDRYKNFKKVTDILAKKTSQKVENLNLFVLAVEMVSNYLKKDSLNNANGEFLVTSVVSQFSSNIILEDFFNKNNIISFCNNIRNCIKKIFICLDGFDTISDDFRRKTEMLKNTDHEEYNSRNEFEILFYRQLMHQVSKIMNKSKPDCMYLRNMFSAVHFCIIIPQDRFEEIRASDRDIIKKSYCALSWDAHDLLEMLVKRLEYIHKENFENSDIFNRFVILMEKYYPLIPLEIPIEIDNGKINISLFDYILRFSFWRPRDIILNFATLMNANKNLGEIYNKNITQKDIIELVKDLVKGSSLRIIKDEFLDEFKYTYRNLFNLINCFEGEDLILDSSTFCSKIGRIPIIYSNEKDLPKDVTVDEKILILYRLGVIGIYYNHDQAKKLGRARSSFIFNEGLDPIDDIITKNRLHGDNSIRLIFNPIFQRYLGLNMNTKDIIGSYSREYILKNHLQKNSIRRL